MIVNTPATPLYILGKEASTCSNSSDNLFCVTTATSAASQNLGQYFIGLTWANPDTNATPKYDGIKLKIEVGAKAPLGT